MQRAKETKNKYEDGGICLARKIRPRLLQEARTEALGKGPSRAEKKAFKQIAISVFRGH